MKRFVSLTLVLTIVLSMCTFLGNFVHAVSAVDSATLLTEDVMTTFTKPDIALANMANLVVGRTDQNFMSDEQMTRGDAAVILMRLYERIW